jgi:ribosomal protein L28
MSRICAICGKGPKVVTTTAFLRSHTNPTGKKRQLPNLQKTTYRGRAVRACVACIKKMYRNK